MCANKHVCPGGGEVIKARAPRTYPTDKYLDTRDSGHCLPIPHSLDHTPLSPQAWSPSFAHFTCLLISNPRFLGPPAPASVLSLPLNPHPPTSSPICGQSVQGAQPGAGVGQHFSVCAGLGRRGRCGDTPCSQMWWQR